MKIPINIHQLYTLCIDGRWIDRISSMSRQLANLLARIRSIFTGFYYGNSVSAKEFKDAFVKDCRAIKRRVRHLHNKIATLKEFINSRRDLKNIIQRTLINEKISTLVFNPPEPSDTDTVIDEWGRLLEEEIYLQSRWEDFERFVRNHSEVEKCFKKHLRQLDQAGTISRNNRLLLPLLDR